MEDASGARARSKLGISRKSFRDEALVNLTSVIMLGGPTMLLTDFVSLSRLVTGLCKWEERSLLVSIQPIANKKKSAPVSAWSREIYFANEAQTIIVNKSKNLEKW